MADIRISIDAPGEEITGIRYTVSPNPGTRIGITKKGRPEEVYLGQELVRWECPACGEVFYTRSNIGGRCPTCGDGCEATWGTVKMVFVPEGTP